MKRILVLGVTGMLGHILFRTLAGAGETDVYGSVRHASGIYQWFSRELIAKTLDKVDAADFDSIQRALLEVKPDVVINCIGIIKQLPEAKDPITSISINALFPHKLVAACRDMGARLIHISTDCVFSGIKGSYTEKDRPDADNLYGRTKLLGEVDCPHCLTLRTSIIGHQLKGSYGLIEWFLAQEGKVKGFTNAVFSGFPTIEIANIIQNYIIPNEKLSGLFHVSSAPISKYDLLKLVAQEYAKQIEIEPDENVVCDRSLDSTKFREAVGYMPPSWTELLGRMHQNYLEYPSHRQTHEETR